MTRSGNARSVTIIILTECREEREELCLEPAEQAILLRELVYSVTERLLKL